MKLDSGLALDIRERIEEDDAFFLDISSCWSRALQDAYR
jgi:predicted proteasome-type protease